MNIDRIVDFSVKNRYLVLILVAFATVLGWFSFRTSPVDAIPDLSDTQVIVYSKWDRSPDVIEDQVTYPIVTAMLGAPHVKAVRGFSDFGYSFVYVVFDEGTNVTAARSRTNELLAGVLQRIPKGVQTQLGPDASGLGWVYQYALVDKSGKLNPADIRTYQDWTLRYQLKSVPGVAEVATVGGFGRQFQVNIDPVRLRRYGVPLRKVVDAVRGANQESGGRLVEFGGTEYMVRGRGYAKSLSEFSETIIPGTDNDRPVRVGDVADVEFGPDMRRGVADFNGNGETVSGIVIAQQGEHVSDVISRVKARIQDVKGSMPAGLELVPVYDRSDLIKRSINTLNTTLIEAMVVVALVIFVFLWHFPSSIIPVITIPVSILIAFIPFKMLGLSINIMSLGGIAIAVGAMVDAAIVVVEQTHKRLEEWERSGRVGSVSSVVVQGVKDVAGPSFFALLVIAVSFLPIMTLEAQEGRLFKPLAYTKNLSMLVAAIMVLTLDPALRILIVKLGEKKTGNSFIDRILHSILVGKLQSEEEHPISRGLIRIYEPIVVWSLKRGWMVIAAAILLVGMTVPVYNRIGREFMPPLDEGALFYMPSTMPGISVTEAQRLLNVTDKKIKAFPEVAAVLGKAGRSDSSTDPAPLSMLETVIVLKPREEWRKVPTWYSKWAPEFVKPLLRRITPDTISIKDLEREMNAAVRVPGLANGWTMPIKARIDMLTTGIRTPVGLKVSGKTTDEIDAIAAEVEEHLTGIRGARSVFAERTAAGYYLDIVWDRTKLARYGLTIDDAQIVVANAIGGEEVSTVVDGRNRYPVNVRVKPAYRSDIEAISQLIVTDMDGKRAVSIADVAEVRIASGPAMIRDEDGMLTGYVYVDLDGRDPQSFVDEGKRVLAAELKLPTGATVLWSGQYENMQRVAQRLTLVVPITLALICILLYINLKSIQKTMIVLLAVPFSAIGAIWLVYALGFNMSIAVWVGLIALMGVDAETGVFMLLYLDLAYNKAKKEGRLTSRDALREVVVAGAARRVRPKFMTVMTMFMGLVPVLWSTGAGSDVMQRIAAPMVGGIFTSFLLELLVYPAIYEVWKWKSEVSLMVHASTENQAFATPVRTQIIQKP